MMRKCALCSEDFDVRNSGKYCNRTHQKECKNCKEIYSLDFSSSTHRKKAYFADNNFCSKECTCLYKYGVKNPAQSQNIKEKTKATNLGKYGVEWGLQSDVVKSKSRKTKLKKYGDENYTNQEKAKKTNLERYGCENPLGSKQIIEKRVATTIKRYGGTGFQSIEILEKSKQTRLKNYGNKNYSNQAKKRQTCLSKYGVTNWNQQHIQNYPEWQNLDQWAKNFKKEKGRKPTYGDASVYFGVDPTLFWHKTDNNKLGLFFVKGTYLELIICDKLDELGIKYKRRDKTLIRPKEIDIYIPSLKLGIEINDKATHLQPHQTEPELDRFGNPKKDHAYHQNKSELARKAGITLLHVWEDLIYEFCEDLPEICVIERIG